MILSISISNFDNSFTNNCLSVHQTNDCGSVGNLGHLLRKPTARILLHTTHRHLSLCHLHIEIWLRRQMYIPGGPIDMTQKITHCWGGIFSPMLLCWAKHRGDFWVIAHLNNAKCVLPAHPRGPRCKMTWMTGNSWWDVLPQKSFHVSFSTL